MNAMADHGNILAVEVILDAARAISRDLAKTRLCARGSSLASSHN